MAGRFFEIPSSAGNADRPAPRSTRIALLVGNASYSGGRLRNAIADVELVADRLRALDFDVTLVVDVGKAALETAIVELSARLQAVGPEAIAFFYFAGHGIQHEGHNFLIPVDAAIPETRYLRSAAVRADRIVEELASVPTRANVVVLDACRNNPLPAVAASSRDAMRGLASVRNIPDATLVIFSTAAGDVADDGEGANGPYASALARRLALKGRRLHEVFFDVSADVCAASQGKQRPALFLQGALPPIVLNPDESRAEAPGSAEARAPPVPQPAAISQPMLPGYLRDWWYRIKKAAERWTWPALPLRPAPLTALVAVGGTLAWLAASSLLRPRQLTPADIANAKSPLTWQPEAPGVAPDATDHFGLTRSDWSRAPQAETINKVIEAGRWSDVERAALRGDAKAVTLAAARLSGIDPRWGARDEATMARLAARAAATGLPAAQTLQAHTLRHGLGVPADQQAAEALFRKAAEGGSALAKYMLGEMLLYAAPSQRRTDEAERWLTAAYDGGLRAMAGLQLGLLHAGDIDKTRNPDYPLAEKWLRRAAEAGQAAAAKRLVQLFETGLLVLTTAEQVKLLAQASDGGDGYASWRLGQRMSAADSADRDIAAATRRYRMGMDQGFHLAAYHLALLYKEGAIGGRSDLRAALPLMERAAELGNPVADLYLGQWHEFGERDSGGHVLVPVDVDKARHFYEAAARKGSAAGVLHLGELYDTAAFGRRDRATARQYYERAAGFEKDRGTSAMALAHIARHDREDQLAASNAPLEVARGNPDATVEVLVYTELDCTTCGSFYRDVLRPIVDKFIDRGLIRLVMRGSGTEARASSMEALLVASCAGQEVRTRVAERILEYQAQWTTSEQRLQALFKLVEPLLTEPDRLRTCLADGANRDRLRRAIAGDPLKAIGIGLLPTVFVNGEIFEGPKLTELEFGLIRALPPQSRGPVWQR